MTKGTNRKVLFASVTAVFLLTLTSFAWGKGTANVTNGLHNLSATGYDPYWDTTSWYATDGDEVCVFCHTPHGGELDTPLWNKDLSSIEGAGVFTHYTNVLLSDALKGLPTDRQVEMESLLCLSCHDGSLSVLSIHNAPNSGVGQPYEIGGETYKEIGPFAVVGARIGATPDNTGGTGDLSDDHPISFSYDDVLADPIYAGGNRDGELRTVAEARGWAGEGVRFFGADNNVECSSCHDPHVEYDYDTNTAYAPFLIMPNTNSSLCFACHNK